MLPVGGLETVLDSVLARNGSDPHRGTDFARSCSTGSVNTFVSARYAWYKPGLVMMRMSHGAFPEPEVSGYRSKNQSVLLHPVSISGFEPELVMVLIGFGNRSAGSVRTNTFCESI